MTGVRREWRNSWIGRTVGTALGLTMIGLPFVVSPTDGSSRTAPIQVLLGVGIAATGAAVMVAVWTSRLVLLHGVLTATHFGRSRSVQLADIESVEPAFWPCTGLIIRLSDGQRLRTLVSGSAGDEFWTTRADRICREIEDRAQRAR